MKTYSAYSKDNQLLRKSSSGGVFGELAKAVLNRHGVVYGVAFSDDYDGAEFKRIANTSELDKLLGSKYLQANISNTFKKIQNDLISKRIVLFSGTPCQCAGLKSFLKTDYENLICVDIVCHGVVSPKVWNKYFNWQQEKYGTITQYSFRAKKHGWKNYNICINKKNIKLENDSYFQIFLRNYSLRPSCYNCLSKSNYQSDITLGDFWGIEKINKKMFNKNGTSVVITRTQKGDMIFADISKSIIYREEEIENTIKYNKSIIQSSPKPKERELFFEDLNTYDWKYMANKYGFNVDGDFLDKFKSVIKKVVKYVK